MAVHRTRTITNTMTGIFRALVWPDRRPARVDPPVAIAREPDDPAVRVPGPLERRRATYVLLWVPMFVAATHNAIEAALRMRTEDGDVLLRSPADLSTAPIAADPRVRFWRGVPEAQALRNRMRIVHDEVVGELARQATVRPHSLRLISLGAGSAGALIEALATYRRGNRSSQGATLAVADGDDASLRQVALRARLRGVGSMVHVVHVDPVEFAADLPDGSVDVLEAAGLFDRMPFWAAVRVCRQARRVVTERGLFITSQIGRSAWSYIMRWAVAWPHLYRRSPADLRDLLGTAGIDTRTTRVVREPTGIHHVAICRF